MPSGVAARRYAQAAFEMADRAGTLDRWERDLSRLAEALADPHIAAYIGSPRTPVAEKRALVQRLLGADAERLVLNLAGLLSERGRLGLLPAIYHTFHELVLARRGIAVGEVTTAVPLTDDEQELVRRRLRTLVGKEVELRTVVDPEIIGGIVARVGDQLIDGSVINQLRRLRERLVTAR